jgi:DNA polymerase III sliding clamp (beta) subunit (PCNA family)
MKKIKADREMLLSKLQKAVKFIPKKPVIPVYENFLIDIDHERMLIYANSGEMQAVVTANITSKEPIMFCIPAKLLVATLSLYREPDVTMVVDDKTIKLSCGKSKHKIAGEDADVFPLLKRPDCPNEMSVQGSALKGGLSTAKQLIDRDGGKPSMDAVNVRFLEGSIILTGGSVMSLANVKVPPKSVNNWDGIPITPNLADMICSSVSDGDTCDLFHDSKKFVIDAGDLSIISTTNEAAYPETDKVFDAYRWEKTFTVHNLEFQDALKRCKLYALPEFGVAKMEIGGKEMVMSAHDSFKNNSGDEGVEISEISDSLSVMYNIDLMLNVLGTMDNGFVEVRYDQSNKPWMLSPVSETETAEYIIMPYIEQ